MKYSLIVPLYNRQDTIRACLDSLLVQEEQDYEIIIVNDGSSDNSGEIADEYANKFNNIKVIHKENGGASSARNAGIEIACGDYLLFPDSDDEYKPNLLSYLNDYYGYDVICFGHEIIYQSVIEKKEITLDNVSTQNNSKQDMLILLEEKGALNVVWNKAYKKELLQNVRFTNEVTAEDLIFNCNFFFKGEFYSYNKRNFIWLY